MGKVSTTATKTTAAEMKTTTTTTATKKKKGRPPKNPPLPTTPPTINKPNSTTRRSTRHNPSNFNSKLFDDDEDDDDERKEKKVKLVVRLPQSPDSDSGSGSGSDTDSGDRAKKRKINGGSNPNQEIMVVKVTEDHQHGSPLESGPTSTTPLPDKKLLVFILDRLQKKDTYGVFSEPVDPDELPDYFEIIEQPMDFGTVRKKLDGGAYKNLEELEADVLLITSNAMQYNAPDTVYYRQARSIQDIAKRDFENLRHEGDDGEPQPKVVRRGRPPNSKNQKKLMLENKPVETSPVVNHRVGATELSSGATLACGEDKATGTNSAYNLRKAPPTLYGYRPSDPFVSSYRPRNGENYSEWLADWNDEFPAHILRADMKHGKKNITVDENRRDTYSQFHPLSSSNNSPALFNYMGDMRRLVPVGLPEPLAYARSLARYAANLGPVAWKIASKKIESALPAGVQYGPGWVGENGATLSNPLLFSSMDDNKQKSSNSIAGDCSSSKLVTPSDGTKFPVQQNPMHHSYRNGFSGVLGYNLSTEEGKSLESKTPGHSHGEGGMLSFGKLPTQQRHNPTFPVPPDLKVRVTAAGSPSSSSLQIGSPQQPDLALQL